MNTIKMRSQAGEDGVLTLRLPVGTAYIEVDVVVVFQTVAPVEKGLGLEERGWLPDFFERTSGSLADDPTFFVTHRANTSLALPGVWELAV